MTKRVFRKNAVSLFLSTLLIVGSVFFTGVDASASTQTKDPAFSIHFIDVGQADAALVQCDGEYMLIDGGNKADSNKIYSVLKKEKVEKKIEKGRRMIP